MFPLTLERIVLIFVILWLFNLLTFVNARTKDIVNAVVIVLLIIFGFLA